MSRLLLLYPHRWRRRFGAEVKQMLAGSVRPVRDRLNLLLAAPRVRLDQLTPEDAMKLLSVLRVLSAVVLGAGLALSAVAVTALQDGPGEFLRHWWSGGSAGLAVLGLAGVVATSVGATRTPIRTRPA